MVVLIYLPAMPYAISVCLSVYSAHRHSIAHHVSQVISTSMGYVRLSVLLYTSL